jgi:hypothetical protein
VATSEASYVIDVAARMPEGESTIAELDAITSELMNAGRGAAHFQEAIAQTSNALAAAKAATAAVKDSLAAANAKYAELERAALQAAKAEERAALKGVVPPEVARQAREAQAAVNAYAYTLQSLEQAAAGAESEEARLARTLANLKKISAHVDKSLADQVGRLGKLQGGLNALGGPLGQLGSKVLGPVKGFKELGNTFGASNAAALVAAAGIGALIAAVAALTVAVAAGTIAIAAWGVKLADSARDAGLARAAVEAMNPGVAALRENITALADETGLGEDQVRALAKGLIDAGESADAMADSLRVAALAERALGAGGAATYTSLVKQAADATKAAEEAAEKTGAVPKELARRVAEANAAVDEFAGNAKRKLGNIVAQQMRSVGAQSQTLKKNIGEIFGGLNIEPVLNGMQTLVELFDKNTAAGQTMKFLFESVFQPIIDQAQNAAYVVEAFALGFLIGLTKLYIALKPVIKTISELFGFDDTALTDTLTSAKNAGEIVAYIFTGVATVFGLVFAAVGAVIAPIIAVTSAFFSLIGVIYDVNVAILGGFMAAWDAVKNFLGGLPPTVLQIGTDLVRGLAAGITGGASLVVEALGGVVSSAINTAKEKLGIASPSKVFAEIGGFTAEGFSEGVDDGAGEAQSALASMVSPPEVAALTSAPAEAGHAPASGGGSSANLSGAVFNFYGVEGAESAVQRFEEALTRVLEGDALQAAGAPA